MKTRRVLGLIFTCSILAFWLTNDLVSVQDKPPADIYKTGKIKFVPELIISDENLGGKDFFGYPNDVAVDEKNDIYICDNQAHNIKKLSGSGEYIKSFGKLGQGPGDLNMPMEIEYLDGRLYVRDLMNHRVSIFGSGGTFIDSFKLPAENIIWHSMKIISDGRFVAHLEKRYYETPTPPSEIKVVLFSKDFASSKNLFERQINNGRQIMKPRRVFVSNAFQPDISWDLDPEGKIVIGYSEKYEILFFDPEKGQTDSFSHPYKPVDVSEKDKDNFFREMPILSGSISGGEMKQTKGAPDYFVENTEFPKTYPPYRDIKADSEGNIWVRPYKTTDVSYDIFTREGKFINRVQLVGEKRYPWLRTRVGKGFWIISEKDDLYTITKVRIEEAR